MSTAVLSQDTRAVGRGRPGVRATLTPGASRGLGIAMVWFSLLVLIPLAAIVATAGDGGWSGYVDTLENPQSWAAIKLTVGQSLLVTAINVVMGAMIAWVLVRDRFWGKRLLDLVIDIPFAMPTIVAGLVLLGLYGRTARSASTCRTRRRRSRWRWRSSPCRSSSARCSRCWPSSTRTWRRRRRPWARTGSR